MKKILLDLLFPRECLKCKLTIATAQTGYVCQDCFPKLDIIEDLRCAFCTAYSPKGQTCPICKDKHYLDRLLVGANYKKSIVENMAKALKYRFATEVVPDIAKVIKKRFPKLDCDCIIPIPLHKQRLRWRGFNQAELIGRELSTLWRIPLRTDILTRKKGGTPQADIKNKESRISNAKGIFEIATKNIRDIKRVAIVDDLSTTGSTLDEASMLLKSNGVEKTIGVVFARG